jgi:hypothetical protein
VIDVTAECTDAEDLRDLHGALLSTASVEQFLHEMAVLAARLVGGGLSCGMTMQSNGRPVTVACSDPVAARVDEVRSGSQNSNVKLRDIAGAIVTSVTCEPLQPAPPFEEGRP